MGINVERLRKLKEKILHKPENFYMYTWGRVLKDEEECKKYAKAEELVETPACGTVACLCGWARFMEQQEVDPDSDPKEYNYGEYLLAEKYLGLNPGEGYRKVFFTENWPEEYRNTYREFSKSPALQANVVGNLIDSIIENGGVWW